ncbi:hypothetical protein [Alkanindiges illinoisensis]|nr:hypothetical protein [Alkanindiges illinoisensis]
MAMMEYTIEGITHKVEYDVFDDELIVYLPDGTTRTTWLRGLTIKTAIRPHLISYLNGQKVRHEM